MQARVASILLEVVVGCGSYGRFITDSSYALLVYRECFPNMTYHCYDRCLQRNMETGEGRERCTMI